MIYATELWYDEYGYCRKYKQGIPGIPFVSLLVCLLHLLVFVHVPWLFLSNSTRNILILVKGGFTLSRLLRQAAVTRLSSLLPPPVHASIATSHGNHSVFPLHPRSFFPSNVANSRSRPSATEGLPHKTKNCAINTLKTGDFAQRCTIVFQRSIFSKLEGCQ